MKLQSVNGQYRKSVGFFIGDDGDRRQKIFYLGDDESKAILKAAFLKDEWGKLCAGWSEVAAKAEKVMALSPAQRLPHWRTNPLEKAAEVVATQPAAKPEPGKTLENTTTIQSARDFFLAEHTKRLTLRNVRSIKQSTINTLRANLLTVLAPFPDLVNLNQLGKIDTLRTIVDYWLGTDHKRKTNGRLETVSERTAINYLGSLKKFLTFCDDVESFGYDLPKGSRQSFTFRIKAAPVVVPELWELTTIFVGCHKYLQCWFLLSLNTGWNQIDIAQLKEDNLVKSKTHWTLAKGRSKTEKQNDFMGYWDLWEPTRKALDQCRVSGRSDKLMLVNKIGNPLYVVREQFKRDAIGDQFHNSVKWQVKHKKISRKYTFKHLRKFGASWIANTFKSDHLTKLYLAQAPNSGVTAKYVKSDYDELKPALKAFGDWLTLNGFFDAMQ